MILKNKYGAGCGYGKLIIASLTATLLIAFSVPFLNGNNHTCPVLQEREPGTVASAMAIPAFARKYNVDCTYCHTVWPQLNRTGIIFRYLGYRLPNEVPSAVTPKSKKASAAPGGAPSFPSQPSQPASLSGAQPATPEQIAHGKKVASDSQCLTCHVNGGNIVNSSKPIKGESFRKKYPEDSSIAKIVRSGVPGTAMPSYNEDKLSDQDLNDLITYIRSLTP